MNDGPNPLTWDAQLLSYWFSRTPGVFQDWLVIFINKRRGGRDKDLSAPWYIYHYIRHYTKEAHKFYKNLEATSKILRARKATNFHTNYPQILVATV
jgi:hypothetical protein